MGIGRPKRGSLIWLDDNAARRVHALFPDEVYAWIDGNSGFNTWAGVGGFYRVQVPDRLYDPADRLDRLRTSLWEWLKRERRPRWH